MLSAGELGTDADPGEGGGERMGEEEPERVPLWSLALLQTPLDVTA